MAQGTEKEGSVKIIQSASIDSLVQQHIEYNFNKTKLPGYRVQIYFGNQRSKANDIKEDFMKKYPDEEVYLLYQQPNYKVRVGDFMTRLEAYRYYRKIYGDFNTTFIVKDEIKKR
jgi:hypothetical protein